MRYSYFVCAVFFLLTAHVQGAPLPPNQLPMYGGLEKIEKLREADAAFLAAVDKSAYSRSQTAQNVVQAGWTALQKGDMTTAIKRFNQAWLLDPENGNAYYGFALVAAQRDRAMPQAEKFFRLAISKKTVAVVAYVDYGRFLWSQNRLDESLEQLQKSLQISPKAFNARSNIAFVYYKKGDFKKSCEWAKGARENHDQLEPGFLEDMCARAKSR